MLIERGRLRFLRSAEERHHLEKSQTVVVTNAAERLDGRGFRFGSLRSLGSPQRRLESRPRALIVRARSYVLALHLAHAHLAVALHVVVRFGLLELTRDIT